MLLAYRILTYVLVPLALLLGLLALVSLMASAANVAALLPAFLCGATVIYIFTSLSFLQKGVLAHQPCKASLYDWIRVNGFVALFMGSLFVFQSIYFRGNTEIAEQMQSQMDAMADEMKTKDVPEVRQLIKWVINFMLVTGVLLLTHVLLGFQMLKKYAGVFKV
jgi:hypothetical protein